MHALIGYFRSIAMAIEIQGNTKTQWRSYDDSTALNIAYAMMPWKEKPGSQEVVQNWHEIEARTQARTHQLLATFFSKFSSSPSAAMNYADSMERMRQDALKSVQEMFRDVTKVNAMVARQAADGARELAMVQFACTLTLAVTGCVIALGAAVPAVFATTGSVGLKVAAVNLSYNIAGALVKDSMSFKSATAIAIETSKTTTGEFAGRLHSEQTKLAEQIATKSTQIRATEANIEKLNAEIARKTSAQKIAKLNAQQAAKREGIRRAEAEIAETKAMKSGLATTLGRGVPLIFLAHDLYSAGSDLSDVFNATR